MIYDCANFKDDQQKKQLALEICCLSRIRLIKLLSREINFNSDNSLKDAPKKVLRLYFNVKSGFSRYRN